MPRAWDIGFTHPFINCQGKSATHFVYFWSRKTFPYTHLEAISYIPQQGQSLHIWNTSLSTIGCYKNKYIIQFLKLVCMSRFSTAISSSKTELALGTIRVNTVSRLLNDWVPTFGNHYYSIQGTTFIHVSNSSGTVGRKLFPENKKSKSGGLMSGHP